MIKCGIIWELYFRFKIICIYEMINFIFGKILFENGNFSILCMFFEFRGDIFFICFYDSLYVLFKSKNLGCLFLNVIIVLYIKENI